MGAYLSAPVTSKEFFEGTSAGLIYGGASMQVCAAGCTLGLSIAQSFRYIIKRRLIAPAQMKSVKLVQGWRRTMEDAHIAATELGGAPDAAMFGVFDGHGGR